MGYHATCPVQNDDYVTASVKDVKGATRFAGENRTTEVNEGLHEEGRSSPDPMGDNAEEVTIEADARFELTDEFVKEKGPMVTALRKPIHLARACPSAWSREGRRGL